MTEKTYYFFREDLVILDARIIDIKKMIASAIDMKVTSVSQTSETWHDNFAFEDAERQINMLSKQLMELEDMRSHVEVVEPMVSSTVGMGSRASYRDLVTGIEKQIKISSYWALYQTGEYESISYESPLAQLLSGKKEGEEVKGKIGNTDVHLLITSVL